MHFGEELPLDVITRMLNLSNASGAKAYLVSAKRKLDRAAKTLGKQEHKGPTLGDLVMAGPKRKNPQTWQEAASATKDWSPLGCAGADAENVSVDAKAATHLAGCAQCQTDFPCWKSFEQSTPSAYEGVPGLDRRQVGAQSERSGQAAGSPAFPSGAPCSAPVLAWSLRDGAVLVLQSRFTTETLTARARSMGFG